MSVRLECSLRIPLDRFALEVDLDLDVDTLAIFGASGSGKTTLIESIAGWRHPATGRVRVGESTFLDTDRNVELDPCERRVGYVPQDLLLFEHLTVESNIRIGAGRERRADGGSRAANVTRSAAPESIFHRVVSVLELGGLLHRSVLTLSGGERQRVALARALCSDPDILLLDEPFGGVDVELRRRILPFLLRLRDSFAIPLIFISHDATEVQALCREIVVLESGRVIAKGPTTATLFRTSRQAASFDNILCGTIVSADGATQTVRVDGGFDLRVTRTDLALGQAARIALAADDILLAIEPPHGLSARNCVAGRVAGLRAIDRHVVVEVSVGHSTMFVSVTPEAVAELTVAAERPIWMVFKSSSCRALDVP